MLAAAVTDLTLFHLDDHVAERRVDDDEVRVARTPGLTYTTA